MPNAMRNVVPSVPPQRAHPTIELLTYGTLAVNRPPREARHLGSRASAGRAHYSGGWTGRAGLL